MERQKLWAREPSLASILAALSELSPMAGGFLGFRCAPPQARLFSSRACGAEERGFLDVKQLRGSDRSVHLRLQMQKQLLLNGAKVKSNNSHYAIIPLIFASKH
jgi:hypothetical protein